MQSSNLIELSPQQPQGRVYTRCFCLEEPLGSVRLRHGATPGSSPGKARPHFFHCLRCCRERGGRLLAACPGLSPHPPPRDVGRGGGTCGCAGWGNRGAHGEASPWGALLSPQEPARASERSSLKGDHGEKVRGGGRGGPSPVVPIPARPLLLFPLPPPPSGAFRGCGAVRKRLRLLPRAGIQAPLALRRCWSEPNGSSGPLCSLRAAAEPGSVPSTPRALRPRRPCSHVGLVPGTPGAQPGPVARAGGRRGGQLEPAQLGFSPPAPFSFPTGLQGSAGDTQRGGEAGGEPPGCPQPCRERAGAAALARRSCGQATKPQGEPVPGQALSSPPRGG